MADLPFLKRTGEDKLFNCTIFLWLIQNYFKVSNGWSKIKAETAAIVSPLTNLLYSAPKLISEAAEANARYKLKLIKEIAFDSKNPLYIALKSIKLLLNVLYYPLKCFKQVRMPKNGKFFFYFVKFMVIRTLAVSTG